MSKKVNEPRYRFVPGLASAIMAQRAQEVDPEDPMQRKNTEIIVESIISLAKRGDVAAAKLFFERVDGKPSTSFDLLQAIIMVQAAGSEAVREAMEAIGALSSDAEESKLLENGHNDGTI